MTTRRASYFHRGGSVPLDGRTIAVFLEEVVRRYPDNEALVSCWQGRRLTYLELRSEVLRLARGLLRMGVGKGDRVGVWATDNIEWVVIQLATAVVGAVLVNVNPAYRSAELEHALAAGRVQTLFLMPAFRKSEYVEMVRQLCPELESARPGELSNGALPELRNVVVFDPVDPQATRRPAPGFFVWGDVLELGLGLAPGALAERSGQLDCDDPINIQFTSGTTGFPKPVVLTHHNILNNGFHVAEALATTEEDRLCVPVPFYHCFGMVVSNLGCLTHGAALVIPEAHFDAGAILSAVETERCTLLHGVPTMFLAELEHEDFAAYDLSSLRAGIMAGAPCPPELMRRVREEIGITDIRIGYGQTECSPVSHCTLAGDSVERSTTTVGTNLPHQEVKIVDPETGTTVPLGEAGEICFRGYHVMRGYYGMPDATAEAIDVAGWLHSGDIGVMDGDGYVSITGRIKEMVIRGGENIYPAEIEHFLCRHPKVAQAAVFGVSDEKWGEDLAAWVRLHPGETATEDELRQFVREGMAHYKVPALVRVVEEFPMTVTGKVQKFRIREIEEARRAEATLRDEGSR